MQHKMFMIEWTIRVEHMPTAQSTRRRYVGVVPGFNVVRGLSLQLTSHAMVMSHNTTHVWCSSRSIRTNVAPITRRQIILLFPRKQQRPGSSKLLWFHGLSTGLPPRSLTGA